jgi:hemoglobin-like flavoprotein
MRVESHTDKVMDEMFNCEGELANILEIPKQIPKSQFINAVISYAKNNDDSYDYFSNSIILKP